MEDAFKNLQEPKPSMSVLLHEHRWGELTFIRENAWQETQKPGAPSRLSCCLQHVWKFERWLKRGQAVYEGLLPVEKARSVAGFWNSPDLLTGEILTTLDTWLSSFFHLLFPGLRNAAVASRASCWCICGHNRSSGKKAKTAALNTYYYSEECFYCNSW